MSLRRTTGVAKGTKKKPNAPPRLFVVSPHLDDAVLSCGNLLARCAGSVVCTVFAGRPREPMRTEWDAASGFADAHEAIAARWREDETALALCGATAVWLDFLDSQYGETPRVDDVAEALDAQFRRFDECVPVCPLGLGHCDHELVGAACRQLLDSGRLERYIAYEDAIYRATPGVLSDGLARVAQAGLRARPVRASAFGAPTLRRVWATKRSALRAYSSQARAFSGFPPDVARIERFWCVRPISRTQRGVGEKAKELSNDRSQSLGVSHSSDSE
ncbi:PIG-L deacetylase family protein [Paraburkholderia tropica]|uniref:PIG-L deacetylase family protein n=1 Tax=Paraburkholderia tropica TaxID=92647 RepID=UPI0009F49A61|nr:PIG-L family deacetylase [Paraburkholderia tropica]